MNERVQYWIETAEYDLDTARAMLETRRFLYVGFMCHQSIEKALKACFVNVLGDNPPYPHNLRKLAVESGVYDAMSGEFKDTVDLLEPLNIESRYPTYREQLLQTLNYEVCRDMLSRTETLYQWIKNRL